MLVPGSQKFSQLEAEWGRDVEFDIWQSIADFRCAGFFRQYMEVRGCHCPEPCASFSKEGRTEDTACKRC